MTLKFCCFLFFYVAVSMRLLCVAEQEHINAADSRSVYLHLCYDYVGACNFAKLNEHLRTPQQNVPAPQKRTSTYMFTGVCAWPFGVIYLHYFISVTFQMNLLAKREQCHVFAVCTCAQAANLVVE